MNVRLVLTLLVAVVLVLPGCRKRGGDDYDRQLAPGAVAVQQLPPANGQP